MFVGEGRKNLRLRAFEDRSKLERRKAMQINTTAFSADDLLIQRPAPAADAAQHRSEIPSKREYFDNEAVADSINRLKETLAENDITLKFSRDENTKAIVVEMVNARTGESIRQIPSTVSLRLAAHFVRLQGQFIDTNE